ncbi:MAG TPA: hypothetical protein PKA00_11970 [Saprospiraceae bacterium]|nr:hypothetical protein [Saprospiraceae bacterium]HMQ83622.1 hypothetical protein [Saprospiraceae bacterium]
MPKHIFLIALLLSLFFSCKQASERPVQQSQPKTIEDIEQQIIREVQGLTLALDNRLTKLTPKTVNFPTEDGKGIQLQVQLWIEGENPLKLAAFVPNAKQELEETSAYYFAGENIFFARSPTFRFIFIDSQLKYWLDADWNIMPMDQAAKEERQLWIEDEAAQYFSVFN